MSHWGPSWAPAGRDVWGGSWGVLAPPAAAVRVIPLIDQYDPVRTLTGSAGPVRVLTDQYDPRRVLQGR